MRNWMRVLIVFVLFFGSQVKAGDVEKSLQVTLNTDERCSSLSVGFSFAAKHMVKGDRGGLLNQNTQGKYGECFLDKDRHFYMLTGALTNSQWCPTLFHGYGIRGYTPKIWRLQGEVGYEVALTHYGQGCVGGRLSATMVEHNRSAYIVPLPMGYAGISVELPRLSQIFPFDPQANSPRFMTEPLGKLTFGMRIPAYPLKGKEQIRLFSIGWTLEKKF